MVREHAGEMPMVLNQLYRALSQPLQDRWLGGLHTGLVINWFSRLRVAMVRWLWGGK